MPPATRAARWIRYDGARFRKIIPKNARKITTILPLTTGGVLLGTATQGVLRYEGTRLRPFHPSLAQLPITALAGIEEDLWAGTRDNGVIHLRAGHAEKFSEVEGLPDKAIHSLAVAGDRAWVGTSTGIAQFRGGKLERTLANGLLAKSLAANKTELLVGTLADGWLRIPLEARSSRAARERATTGGFLGPFGPRRH